MGISRYYSGVLLDAQIVAADAVQGKHLAA
jgi:hypothetical protein